MEWNERVIAHLMWIWGGEEGFMKRKREGMFVVTDKRLAFITKTNMSYRVHEVHSLRQRLRFREHKNIFLPIEGYGIPELKKDIEKSDQNMEFPFHQISDIFFLERRWGTELKIKFNIEANKIKSYTFRMVRSWVKYPAKDPLQFYRMDWTPLITLFKTT